VEEKLPSSINEKFFFDYIRLHLFDGSLLPDDAPVTRAVGWDLLFMNAPFALAWNAR